MRCLLISKVYRFFHSGAPDWRSQCLLPRARTRIAFDCRTVPNCLLGRRQTMNQGQSKTYLLSMKLAYKNFAGIHYLSVSCQTRDSPIAKMHIYIMMTTKQERLVVELLLDTRNISKRLLNHRRRRRIETRRDTKASLFAAFDHTGDNANLEKIGRGKIVD